jgi:lipopolysaccharide export system protein LptC
LKAITKLLARLTNFTRLLFLGSLTLVSWWGAEHFGPPVEKGKKLQPGKVDYYSKGLQRTVMDEAGKPKEMLVAEELVHYEDDNHSELTKPVMTLYTQSGPPWVIHAETATLPGDGEQIFLNGDVLVLRDANASGRTMRIETRNARVQPDQNYAETDEDIRVISPPDYMIGTGAKLKFGDGIQYSVLANVRRKHDVQKQSRR